MCPIKRIKKTQYYFIFDMLLHQAGGGSVLFYCFLNCSEQLYLVEGFYEAYYDFKQLIFIS